jgi:hypothetical protein
MMPPGAFGCKATYRIYTRPGERMHGDVQQRYVAFDPDYGDVEIVFVTP